MAQIEDFIERWKKSNAAERSNFQLFMSELCAVLDLPQPHPATENEADNGYVFERNVRFHHDDGSQSIGRIDLYKRGCFVLEGKQSRKREQDERAKAAVQLGLALGEASIRTGSGKREGRGWDAVMAGAKQQAESYAKALPTEEGWPPFIIVVDVGHVIEVYADFSLQGKYYAQFPDRQGYRIRMDDLAQPEVQERLRAIWTDPLSLDPAKRTAKVTREIADLLAQLSKALEKRGYNPGSVAGFLMRCLFTMFAEDVGLLREEAFQHLLEQHVGKADQLHLALPHLWKAMNDGGYSPTFGETILKFNGGLFKDTTAIPLDEQDLNWLILAAKRKWEDVEPAIFGTLLERALDKDERHKLGAHYTPRAYVERLVAPTIIEPLTEDWRSVQAAAADLLQNGEKAKAIAAVKAFHTKLCNTRVLDPACGTGNFLYVAMELMKKLEGEVLDMLADLGDDQYMLELDRHTVDPHQFLGLELNPRAVAIAELVLWIGYLQWHFRTRGKTMPAEPVLKAFANIKEQDAVLAYKKQEILRDKSGHPLTRWDGVTKKLHPITGEKIPDPDAQVARYQYVEPRPAQWPAAEFVVGNPPFLGKGAILRQSLGDDYVDALRKAYPKLPAGIDFVVYWWEQAAQRAQTGTAERFGLITTNSISQSMNRRVLQRWLTSEKPLSLRFAVPDHPWVDTSDGAAVRIAMSVADAGHHNGHLLRVIDEREVDSGEMAVRLSEAIGYIHADLTIGADIQSAVPLTANSGISCNGVMLASKGFRLAASEAAMLRNRSAQSRAMIKRFLHGSDLTDRLEGEWVIDTYGLSEDEAVERHPVIWQALLERVKPQRENARDASFRNNWWLFGRNRPELRRGLGGLQRFIATTETAKHRFFQFISADTIPDHMLVCIADADAWVLGTLSSRVHVAWVLAAGGTLEDRPRYNKTVCFDPFPFPTTTDGQKVRIRELGERLDAFRKERLAAHKALTMTKMYNVLEKLRSGEALDEKEKAIHEMGLVSVLKQIHDDIDAAVAEAYGWPADLSDDQILEKLVALNKERAAEEREGKVRWLRPEFQAPKEVRKARQIEAELGMAEEKAKKPSFPRLPGEQVAEVRRMLAAEGKPVKAGELARRFKQGKRVEARVSELLQIMTAIGQAQTENGSRYFAAR